jgi:hypothetical protein
LEKGCVVKTFIASFDKLFLKVEKVVPKPTHYGLFLFHNIFSHKKGVGSKRALVFDQLFLKVEKVVLRLRFRFNIFI